MSQGEELPDFEDVYSRDFSELDEGLDVLLKKLAILTHIFSRDFQLFVEYGRSEDLLESMWDGRFAG